ncbi:MAG: nucleotidyltransferase substrate binding protein [Victivallales bacterium]|nr:nucleotidyltransferase substrate binding protein [Victivallales bacterium]
MILELDSLKKATASLSDIITRVNDPVLMASFDEVLRNGLRAGVIQNFEFTYELCWKFIKRWLEHNLGSTYVDGVTRHELFRYAAEHKLITDVQRWMDYHRARNMTSHTYNADTADEVFNAALAFIADAKTLLQQLEARND